MSDLIQIATTRGSRVVRAHILLPGLAVTPWRDDDRPGTGWSITHVESGRRLSSYGPLCRRCASALGPAAAGIDWTRPLDELRALVVVALFVQRIDRQIEQCTGMCGSEDIEVTEPHNWLSGHPACMTGICRHPEVEE